MTKKAVTVVDSGSGNLRSVAKALEKVGASVTVSADPSDAKSAERLVVPGQGAFESCMVTMNERGTGLAIAEFIASGRPYFGICLGLQVLFERSHEHAGADGLAQLAGEVTRLEPGDSALKVPHIGWNQVRPTGPDPMWQGLGEAPFFYYVHSYRAEPTQDRHIAAVTEYGQDFAAAIRYENVFACQFHPEKSQRAGLTLLSNFVNA